MTIDELQVLITANSDKLQKEINKTNRVVEQMRKNAEKQGSLFTNAFSKIKTGIKALAIGALIKKVVIDNLDDAINRLDTLNNFTKVMSNLGISTEDANKSLKRLSDGLVGLPTKLDDAVQSVQRLTSANGNVKASTEIFLALNNAILAGGASAQIQSSALEQLSQAYSKGKPDMMEWRTAMMAMPAQLKQVALAMGYVDANQLGEALRSGTVSMNEFMVKIAQLNKNGVNGFKSFEEQARNATGGVSTSITNVKTALTRGLTEILNAIGQSNIAGFFQGIARAINAVIPYITAFVKVVVSAVSAITSLFGKKTEVAGGLVESTSIASNNIGGLSKDMASANKSAKQMKNTLAGFDEITNLNFDTGSGSSDNSSGGAGSFDFSGLDMSGFDVSVSETTNKVDEIVQRIQNSFNGIDFEPLKNSIAGLKDLFEPLKNFTFTGLSDFYNSFLLPIGKWTIGEGLPRLIDSFKDGLMQINWEKINTSLNNLWQALSPFSINVGEGLLWFWKNILQPLGTWTVNEVVPLFLDGLSNVLKILNNTIDALKPLGTWLWEKFLEPIAKWTGGVIIDILQSIVDKLGKFSDWINNNQPLVENIAIVVGSFVAVFGGLNLAIGLWNVIGPIATGVTTALGTAFTFLTSPIGLVLIAIAGVIAIVVILIRHWEEVKAGAQRCWEGICQTWEKVATWFEDNITKPIANFFGGLWTGIKTGASTLATFMKDKVIDPIVNLFKGMYNSVVGIIEGIINGFIGIINGFIRGINRAIEAINNIPGVDLPTIRQMETVNIPRLARGGIVDKPTQALIGEAGKEAVLPLENNTGWMDKMASKFAVMFSEIIENIDINLNNKMSINGRDLAIATIEDFNREAIRRGYKPLLQV